LKTRPECRVSFFVFQIRGPAAITSGGVPTSNFLEFANPKDKTGVCLLVSPV